MLIQKLNLKTTRLLVLLLGLLPALTHAEYHSFNTGHNSDGIVQEVRWPYWAESTYNAIYSQTLLGSDGADCYFYGGMPSDPYGNPPCSIIWSFWPPLGTAAGKAVTAEWTGPTMFAPPHIGEGASGKASGAWPLITTDRWYREVLRVWQPTDGTPNVGYAARWLRDPNTGIWYHLATMKAPFAATGINGLGGFQEDFSHGNRNPRRTDYRNVYYRQGGPWQMANKFTASVRQTKEKGRAYLIDGDTAAYFEVSMDPAYVGNLDNDAGQKSITLTMVNQPTTPSIDPIVISSSGASVSGNQLLVDWQLPATSSPQFAYKIEVFNNSGYTGSPSLSVFDIAPETRQHLLDITGIATPYVRLTITDIFEVTSTPILITPPAVTLVPATSVPAAVHGLGYKYFEKASDFTVLPNFSALTPVFQGMVNYPDLTIRDQRDHYAFEYSGYLEVPADGIYTFTLYSSDGSKLLIDGATVVNWDGRHSPGPLSGWAALQAGKHAVKLQYFFDNQNSGAGDLIDSLKLSWSGPGFSVPVEVPVNVWYRVPSAGEPLVTLSSPSNGASISGAEVMLRAEVTPNGATIEKVRFYVGDTYWGEDTSAPYELNAFVWAAPSNSIHARVFYNAGKTLDSTRSIVSIDNMPLAPWENHAMSEHTYPQGARVLGGDYSLVGDGLNFLGRQVAGDCTLIARVSDLIGSGAGPDGKAPDWSWEAGIIMRETVASTPGMPLGNNGNAQYAALFATVNRDTHYQDGTMANAGGPYWSDGLGGQRWLKLQRVGNTFTTSVSADGSSWTEKNSVELAGINSTLYVGMFTHAPSSQNPNVHRASFDSLSIVGNMTGPPAVTVTPQVTTVYSGQTARFTALPSGNPPFSYQWQYNGTNLVGETAATLDLSNLQFTHSGLYTVVMTNASGSASATAKLSVLTPLPVTAEVLAKTPLSYWRLNDAGPVAADSVGSNNGTGQGGVVFGAVGAGSPFSGFESGNRAAQFNGTDSAIAIPPQDITTANFTMTGWAKRNGSQVNNSGLLFSRPGGGVGIMIVNNKLRFSWDDTPGEYNWDSGLSLTDGQWTFFALTISPTEAILYKAVNGTLSSAKRTGENAVKTLNASFFMGYDPNNNLRRFKGAIDEVAFYNRTLSSAELQNILNASLVVVPEVALSAPADDAVFAAPANVSIAANVTPNGKTITKVQFFNGSVLLGEDTTAPYSLNWNGVAAGSYTLMAQAVYSGGTMSSAPINISVQTAPGVASIPNPADAAAGVAPSVLLGWTAGAMATSHKVYFGASPTPAFQGNQTGTTFNPGPLQSGTTYYWAVDEVNSIGTTLGPVWSFTTSAGFISMNFEENNNQHFAGGLLIGPMPSDSANWNAGAGANGSLANLIDNSGVPTGADISWNSSNLGYNSDGTGDDERRMSVGYLDDGNSGSGKGATVTVNNIPYATYKVYGLFASSENNSGAVSTRNFNVNGTWALGGTASTSAPAWGGIGANKTANGSYWTEIVSSSVTGNYWTVETSGKTCSIVGEIKSGSARGSLTAVIIEDMGGVFTTNAPTWNSSPINGGEAAEGKVFNGSLAGEATDLDGDTLTYSKVSGPVWLSVAPNGVLSGTPSHSDAGSNSWTVAVTDGITAPVENMLNLTVVTAVEIENYSFELPADGKKKNWSAVPGWSSDSTAADSGVENANATDGSWSGYLKGSDPAVWNLTGEFIAPNEVYTLRVDAKNTGSCNSLRIGIYYDNGGSRVALATRDATLTGTMQEFVLQFDSATVPAAVGQKIGIELDNVVGGWCGFDHIRLSRTGAADSDGDLIPDWWETEMGLDPNSNDAALNSDSDPFDNFYEYVTDTDPKDGNSYQTFAFEAVSESGVPTLRFSTSARRNYVVEYRDDLSVGVWQDLGSEFSGTGTEMTVSDTAPVTNRFYRLRVSIP